MPLLVAYNYARPCTVSVMKFSAKSIFYLYFLIQPAIDGDRVIDDLKKSVSRNTGFDCVMRVRCSSGMY